MITQIRSTLRAPAFVLGSVVATYPDTDFCENVGALLSDEQLDAGLGLESVRGLNLLKSELEQVLANQNQLDDLRSEFIDTFDRGKEVSSLYETEYGRERAMVKGNELADIAGFYKAFGFDTGGEGVSPEMVDHVAVELEFYALLLFKCEALEQAGDLTGLEIVTDARKKFLKAHLGRFLGALCARPGVQSSSFYSVAFKYCHDLVMDECKSLEIELEPVAWLSGQVEPADITCGGNLCSG